MKAHKLFFLMRLLFSAQLRKAIIDTVPASNSPHGSGIKSQSFEGYHLSEDQVW